jgi:hypothetical protein
MKKFSTLLLIILVACIIGGVYGALHDQLSYTISPEYFTRFKFIQFELSDAREEVLLPHPRWGAAIVGFLATWWMGVPLGLILGLVGLRQDNWRKMWRVSLRAIVITLLVAFFTGIAGLAFGKIYLAEKGVSWWLPDQLADTKNFIAVGSLHNFGYLGGVLGLFAGILYSLRQRKNKPPSLAI